MPRGSHLDTWYVAGSLESNTLRTSDKRSRFVFILGPGMFINFTTDLKYCNIFIV